MNIGSGERISIADLLERRSRGRSGVPIFSSSAPERAAGRAAVLVPDVGRLRDEVGFRPRWTLDEGLADAIGWWRAASSPAENAAAGQPHESISRMAPDGGAFPARAGGDVPRLH